MAILGKLRKILFLSLLMAMIPFVWNIRERLKCLFSLVPKALEGAKSRELNDAWELILSFEEIILQIPWQACRR